MTPQVQPRLIVLGIALALVGILALGIRARTHADDTRVSAPLGEDIPARHADPDHVTIVWPIVGGLGLAVGAALIGVGMNRWRRV